MKRRLIASITFNTPTQRSSFNAQWRNILSGKALSDYSDTDGEDRETGKPNKGIDTRFNVPAEAGDAFTRIKTALNNVPWLQGTVSIHNCNHDEQPYDCRTDLRAEYQEFVK